MTFGLNASASSWQHGLRFVDGEAGIAAQVIQANASCLAAARVRAIFLQSADDLGKPGNDDYYGLGRVNASGPKTLCIRSWSYVRAFGRNGIASSPPAGGA